MKPPPSFLDELKRMADDTATAEAEFRREIAERTKKIEYERAFAFRRLNLIRAIAEVVAGAEGEEIAVAVATAVLRSKLGWSEDSEPRDLVISRFVPVAQAMYASLSPAPSVVEAPTEKPVLAQNKPPPNVIDELASFESWYVETHPKPFWVLFEHYMPETPRVDF
jgi:hypothetical protein